MIYDGLAKLIDGGDIEGAEKAIDALLNFTDFDRFIKQGGTAEEYIRQIFRDRGIALETGAEEYAEYANSALETMLEVAPDKALEKTNLEDILTKMLGGESLYDIVNEMAKEQLSSLGEEYVTDENIASVGGAILEALFGDTPEILSLIDANTG